MLTWIVTGVFCLGVIGWVVLGWWMGWIEPKLDAAIKEFEEEEGRGVQMHPVDWEIFSFGVVSVLIIAILIVAAIKFGLFSI